MTTNGQDVFDLYNKAFKSWAEVWSSQSKMWAPGAEAFKTPGVDEWFRPWSGYLESWQRMGQGFSDMARGMRMPFESARYSSESVGKGINLYMKLYEAWLKTSEKLAREGLEIGRRLGTGEKPDVGAYMDSLRAAYDETSRSVVASMKETPLAGVKNIDEAVRKALDSFPEEQRATQDFLNQLFDFTVETIKISTGSMAEAVQSFSDLLEKGTISTDTYRNLIDGYGKMLKQSIEILRPQAALFPGLKQVVDDAICWATSSFDVNSCWLEMNLKLQKSIRDSYLAVSRASQEAFAAGQAPLGPDEFFKNWASAYQKSISTFVDTSQMFVTVPSFIQSYADCLKAAGNLYSSAMVVPLASKSEIDRLEAELEKMKSHADRADRAARPAARAVKAA